jgi:hypothetical protein
MTTPEFIELIFMANALVGQHATDFISIVFAYVLAGHFVGANLSRLQFVVLTFLYSGFAAGIAIAALASIHEMVYLRDLFVQQHPVEAPPIMASGFVAWTFFVPPILFFCAWVISIWYVASSRRRPAQPTAP